MPAAPTQKRCLALAATLLLVAACGPTAAPPTATPAPASATTSPTARVTPSPPPAVTQRFAFGDAAVVDTTLTRTNDLYINPGALIPADGVLHMFPNSFSAWPGKVKVPHLTSADGLTWRLDTKHGLAIDGKDVSMAAEGLDVSTGYIADDGTWVLIFSTVANSTPWVLGRATAPGPNGPWTVEETPILTAGPAGSFDAGGVQWPSVVKVGNRWALYYAGFDSIQGGTGSIGVAWSDNGMTWQKQADPVLTATEKWEGRSLDRPRVVQTSSGLVMLYAGRDLTDRGLATSADGVAWTKVPGPNIEQKDFPIQARAWDSALVARNAQLEYFLEIGSEQTRIYRATLAWP